MNEIKFYNLHRGYGGTIEHVPSDTETIQDCAMSIPALLQRAMLGTVDSSGFMRFAENDLYDQPAKTKVINGRSVEFVGSDFADGDIAPTFGMSAAEASSYVERQLAVAKAELDARKKQHAEKDQPEQPPEPKGNAGGSDAE